LRHSLGAVETP